MRSALVDFGVPNGETAMSRTVLPASSLATATLLAACGSTSGTNPSQSVNSAETASGRAFLIAPKIVGG